MELNEIIKMRLLGGIKWLNFMNIVACIGLVLLVIFSVIMITVGINIPGLEKTGTFVGIIYLICAAIYVYPLLKSCQFVKRIRKAFAEEDQLSLEEGFGSFASALQYMGVLTLIVISFYVIAIIAAIAGAAIGMGMGS